jgi:L-lactate dehydrogenase complex protein LldG
MTEIAAQPDTRIEHFATRATPLGTQVEHAQDVTAAAAIIRQAASEAGVNQIWYSSQLAFLSPTLIEAIAATGVEPILVNDRDGARDQAIGLSLAARAIVETGSVLLDERTIEDRATSIMTLHHITIVPMDRVVDSLDDVAEVLRLIASRPGGGYASFITGPSRTADIEMSLTVGVQGPRQVTIVFVDRVNESGSTL